MGMTVRDLAQRLGAQLIGENEAAGREVSAVMPAELAGADHVTFATDAKYEAAAARSAAAAVIVARSIPGLARPQLLVADVNAALIEALNQLAPEPIPPIAGNGG